ncbi:hypothetical protein LY76DRAFT_643641 [Colletotrichum caudatum]|nr:hypothetical protein LY76DRAFT_643641 [Colletotrichum caudatum]
MERYLFIREAEPRSLFWHPEENIGSFQRTRSAGDVVEAALHPCRKDRSHGLAMPNNAASVVYPPTVMQWEALVGNELDWHTVPPGRVETTAAARWGGSRRKKQHYQHDFSNYAGLVAVCLAA